MEVPERGSPETTTMGLPYFRRRRRVIIKNKAYLWNELFDPYGPYRGGAVLATDMCPLRGQPTASYQFHF